MRHHEPGTWWQGDREISAEDIACMRAVAQRFPGFSRTELTDTLCEQLEWLTPAGRPKYTACAKLLARLEEVGELRLPALRNDKRHPGPRARVSVHASARTDPAAPLIRSLSELDPIRLRLAGEPRDASLWNASVERDHLPGYKKPFGYRARYFIESEPHRLGCVLLGDAAKAWGARDQWLEYQTSPKLIFAKPLQADFRAWRCSNQLKGRTER